MENAQLSGLQNETALQDASAIGSQFSFEGLYKLYEYQGAGASRELKPLYPIQIFQNSELIGVQHFFEDGTNERFDYPVHGVSCWDDVLKAFKMTRVLNGKTVLDLIYPASVSAGSVAKGTTRLSWQKGEKGEI